MAATKNLELIGASSVLVALVQQARLVLEVGPKWAGVHDPRMAFARAAEQLRLLYLTPATELIARHPNILLLQSSGLCTEIDRLAEAEGQESGRKMAFACCELLDLHQRDFLLSDAEEALLDAILGYVASAAAQMAAEARGLTDQPSEGESDECVSD